MKFVFNAQGLKVIMVVLHVWIMKIYVATIELHRKEKGGGEWSEFSLPQKLMVFWVSPPVEC
jgi:hypothetical protein